MKDPYTWVKLKAIWEMMGSIPEGEFQKMPKTMQKNYDRICNYLEKRFHSASIEE